jgi:hypothetical protein
MDNDRLAKLLRMLGSSHDAEVLVAVRKIVKLLKENNHDLHWLASRLSAGDDKKFTEKDAAEIYSQGFQDGKVAGEATNFRTVRAWESIVRTCSTSRPMKSAREKEFVDDMLERILGDDDFEPSERQASWLRKIYARAEI